MKLDDILNVLKNKNLKIILPLLLLGIVLGAFLGFFFDKPGAKISTPYNKQDVVGTRTYWKSEIDRVGIEQAYKEIKSKYKITDREGHSALHLFGELLYEKVGLPGIKYCDDAFSNGCYHGFFVGAVAAQGIDVVKGLNKICIDTFGQDPGCQHGIGHGILEYVGLPNLTKALTLCDDLTWKKKVMGCTQGVFMEYNFPLSTVSRASSNVRHFEENNEYKPCNDIPDKYKFSCYHELGQYMTRVYENDYTKLSQFCSGIKDPTYRKYCVYGMGYYAPPAMVYDITKIQDSCSKMGGDAEEVWCRVGARQELMGDPRGTEEKIVELCDNLDSNSKEQCKASNYSKDVF